MILTKYVKTLRVKMTKRVRKTTKGKNKKHEDQRKPARVRKPSRVKEDCQVPGIQKFKSLEDWHHLRVKKPKRMAPPYPLQQEEGTERKRERHP